MEKGISGKIATLNSPGFRQTFKKEVSMKFIDFILDAQNNPGLMAEFMTIDDEAELKTFFRDKGYTDIKDDEFSKILKARKIQHQLSLMQTDRRAY
jgi:hypothetical protein